MDAKAEVPFEREGLVIDTFETSPQLSSEGDRNDGSTRIFLPSPSRSLYGEPSSFPPRAGISMKRPATSSDHAIGSPRGTSVYACAPRQEAMWFIRGHSPACYSC